MSYLSSLVSAQKKIEEAVAAAQAGASEQLAESFQQFFADHPQVHTIYWHQFTPYFNDGDTCEFGVGEASFLFIDENGAVRGINEPEITRYSNELTDWDDFKNSDGSVWKGFHSRLPFVTRKTYDACRKLADELYGSIAALDAAFGDHVQVIVTRDGITVEFFDHD